MRQTLIVTCVFTILICLLSAIDISYPPAGFTTRHDSLSNLSYSTSGHTGFARTNGNATITFQCKDLNASGSVNSTGNLIYRNPPNNASFTLTGLSEKNYSSLANKPTTFAGFGLSVASSTLFTTHVSISTPHGIDSIVNPASVSEHIATNTAHGGSIVDYNDLFNDTVEKPWHRGGEKWASYMATGTTDRYGHTALKYNNKMWIIGGYNTTFRNDVQYSEDGLFWKIATTSANFSPRQGHASVVFNNKMWVIGGFNGSYNNDVWNSSDGITWTKITENADFSERTNPAICVHDNKMWILGGVGVGTFGTKTDLWNSTDGVSWTQVTTSLFSARSGVNLISYNNKMWAFGGVLRFTATLSTECYESTNGITWSLATTTLNLGGVAHGNPIIYSGKCWVVDGWRSPALNQSWYSTDMINWSCATIATTLNSKRYHGTVAFNGRIFLIGGLDSYATQTCDFNYD